MQKIAMMNGTKYLTCKIGKDMIVFITRFMFSLLTQNWSFFGNVVECVCSETRLWTIGREEHKSQLVQLLLKESSMPLTRYRQSTNTEHDFALMHLWIDQESEL